MNSSSDRIVIAIDGPAGAGKSTVARLVSGRLAVPLLDTGAMYRAVALMALRSGWAPGRKFDDAGSLSISFGGHQGQFVILDGVDVSGEIRSLEVSQAASQLSTDSAIRALLVRQQQSIIAAGSWVLEGRDVTTVVAPEADVKVFLTASIEERARRRWRELQPADTSLRLQTVVKEVVERDYRDYTREDSPLQLAEDAVIIESFGLTADQVADQILHLAAAIRTL